VDDDVAMALIFVSDENTHNIALMHYMYDIELVLPLTLYMFVYEGMVRNVICVDATVSK